MLSYCHLPKELDVAGGKKIKGTVDIYDTLAGDGFFSCDDSLKRVAGSRSFFCAHVVFWVFRVHIISENVDVGFFPCMIAAVISDSLEAVRVTLNPYQGTHAFQKMALGT